MACLLSIAGTAAYEPYRAQQAAWLKQAVAQSAI